MSAAGLDSWHFDSIGGTKITIDGLYGARGLPSSTYSGGIMEQPEFDVLLTDCGSQRLDVVQAVRAVTGLSAWQSSQLLGSLPAVLLERVRFDVAVEAADQIQVSGGDAALSCDWCKRVIALGTGPVSSGPCADWSTPPCPASRSRF